MQALIAFPNSAPVKFERLSSITAISKSSGKPSIVTDIRAFSPNPDFSYIFLGEKRLHVDGNKIEYVLTDV